MKRTAISNRPTETPPEKGGWSVVYEDAIHLWIPELPPALCGEGGFLKLIRNDRRRLLERWTRLVMASVGNRTASIIDPSENEALFTRKMPLTRCTIVFERRDLAPRHALDWSAVYSSFDLVGRALVAAKVLHAADIGVVRSLGATTKRVARRSECGVAVTIMEVVDIETE